MIPTPASAPSPLDRVAGWLTVLGLPLLSLLIVRPWVPEAFPVWDYGEMLPLLRGGDGWFGPFSALVEFYRLDGRANFLTYGQIALTWHLVGDSPLGWQAQRSVLMLGAGWAFALAAWRSGASAALAGLGALVLLLGVPAVEGWLFLMGEPLALILLIAFWWLARDYRTSPAWRARAVAMAGLALGVLWTKEILGVCLPFLALVALGRDGDGHFARPARDNRTTWLVVALGIVLVLQLALQFWAFQGVGPRGYAASYGTGELSAGRLLSLTLAMGLPAWFASSGLGAALYPANLLTILVLAGAAAAVARGRVRGDPAILLLGILPLVGALSYGLWPRYSAFYGIPFQAGAVGLFVAAATVMSHQRRVTGWVAHAALLLVACYLAVVADRTVKEKHALAGVAEDVAHAAGRWEGVDTVVVIGPERGIRRWPVTAGELQRYAVAIGIEPPITASFIDESCARVADRLRSGVTRVALVGEPSHCGPLPIRSGTHVRAYTFRDWLTGETRPDSVLVERLVPSEVFQGRAGAMERGAPPRR